MPYLSIILDYLPIIITALIAAFTGLYWRDAKRAFRLELDRVVLWFRLEEIKEEKAMVKETLRTGLDKQINKVIDTYLPIEWIKKHEGDLTPEKRKELRSYIRKKIREEMREKVTIEINKRLAIERQAGDLAFFETLKSKKLRGRLRDYEKKQTELTVDLLKKQSG